MLRLLSHKLKKYAKGWLVFFLFLIDILFLSFLMPAAGNAITGEAATVPIDLMFFYTPQTVYKIIAGYGATIRETYLSLSLSIDIAHPIVYTLFLSLLITWLFQKAYDTRSNMQKLNVVPFGAFAADLLENLGIITMISIYPKTPAVVAWLTTFFTMSKWIFVGASAVLVVIGFIAWITKTERENRSHRRDSSHRSSRSTGTTFRK